MDPTLLHRPVFVLAAPGVAVGPVTQALVGAPGAWDGGIWTPDNPAPPDVPEGAGAGAVDIPRMVCVLPAGPGHVARAAAAFEDALFLLVHRTPLKELDGVEVSPEQWQSGMHQALTELQGLDRERWTVVDWEDLVREPDNEAQRIFAFLTLGWHPLSSDGFRSPADPGVEELTVDAEPVTELLRPFLTPAAPSLSPSTAPGSLTAHNRGLGHLLHELGCSVAVSTYQSNRLIVLRHDDGNLGVHLREFVRPMGIALTPYGFALGTRSHIIDFREASMVAERLEPKGKHDACFLPRNTHVTGDIAIHDMGHGDAGLWVVATAFNCLATLDDAHSFVPRWMPPFITELAAEDRCHLNGMALVDGKPRFVTALGTANTVGGWRAGKASGGVVMDIASGEPVLEGLSMPHSPRWHDGYLYLLESGRGRLLRWTPGASGPDVVAEVPGFTRGLSFFGPLAFVGTSQVRETATFGELPISRLDKRECGVWVVDTRNGDVIASVVFEDRVQEIFDVAAMPGLRFPEVVEEGGELLATSWALPSHQPLPL